MPEQDVRVTDHEIHALFPLDCGGMRDTFDQPSATKSYEAQITQHRLNPAWVSEFLENPAPESQDPLWIRLEPGKGISLDDFQPHIRQILGQSDQPLLCLAFRLRTPKVLSQIRGGKPRTWDFPLGKAAQARCGRENMPVQLLDARFFMFRTGIAILDIAWKYPVQEVTPDGVLEGNYLLSHDNHYGSTRASGPEILRTIADALLPTIQGNRFELHGDRRILYSLVQYRGDAATEDTLSTFALRLALRQNNAYLPDRDAFAHGFYQPFPYLCHAAAVEGGATVIQESAEAPEFIRSFLRDKGRNTYLPLFIAEMHNHFWLLRQSQWLPARRSSKGSRSEKQEIAEIYEATVEYRRFFSPILVSEISVHNTFHELWQRALRIQERTRQVEEISQVTVSLLQEKRTRWIGRISGGIGGFLVTREILEALSFNGFFFNLPPMEEWFARYPSMAPVIQEMLIHRIQVWDGIVFLGSVAGGLLGLWISWNFDASMKKE